MRTAQTLSHYSSHTFSNYRPSRDHAVLWDNDDAVTDVVAEPVVTFDTLLIADDDALADARILVDDGALDDAAGADADRYALTRGMQILRGFVEVGAHHDRMRQARAATDDAANADDRMVDLGVFDAAAFAHDRLLQAHSTHPRTWQKARPRKDRRSFAEQV